MRIANDQGADGARWGVSSTGEHVIVTGVSGAIGSDAASWERTRCSKRISPAARADGGGSNVGWNQLVHACGGSSGPILEEVLFLGRVDPSKVGDAQGRPTVVPRTNELWNRDGENQRDYRNHKDDLYRGEPSQRTGPTRRLQSLKAHWSGESPSGRRRTTGIVTCCSSSWRGDFPLLREEETPARRQTDGF